MANQIKYATRIISFTKKTITTLLLAFLFLSTQAQTLDTSITPSYPSSIVLRVYDVATKINVSQAQQISIADLFQDEEQTLISYIATAATPNQIDSLKNLFKTAFNQLLTTQQIKDYYTICNATKVNATARLTALMLKNKYNTDATMQQYFNNIISWREEQMSLIWQRNVDTTNRNSNLYYTIYAYDSLLNIYTNAAASSNYFVNKIYFLDSILPIDSTQKRALATSYYNNVMQYKNKAYADNFKDALATVFNKVADSPYYAALHKNEIAYTAINATQATLTSYIKRDKISINTAQQVLPILLQRERTIALLNKIYPYYTAAKDSITDTLTYVYQQQIDDLIARGATLVNSSQIDVAIYYATQLEIHEDPLLQLQQVLDELNNSRATFKISNPYADYDSKAYESEQLSNILTEDQYTQVLTLKYTGVATKMANRDWGELVRLKLNSQFKEANTKIELTNYHIAVLIAYYRNAHNIELQYASIQSINEIMPDALRTIIDNWNYSTPYSDTPYTFFQW